jgi:hypothetical protein
MFSLPERCKIVEALTPAADAGGRTGAYVSLKNAHKAWVVVHLDQGAANTVAITLEQASTVAGTGSKPITGVVPIWSNLDCTASDELVKRTSAVGYTTDAGVKHKQVVFEVDPAYFDIANGFDCLAVITGASVAANITSAQYFLEERYMAPTPPTAVAN